MYQEMRKEIEYSGTLGLLHNISLFTSIADQDKKLFDTISLSSSPHVSFLSGENLRKTCCLVQIPSPRLKRLLNAY